jgi:hypothetical protein
MTNPNYTSSVNQQSNNPTTPLEKTREKSKTIVIILITIIVFLLLLISTGIYFFFFRSTSGSIPNTPWLQFGKHTIYQTCLSAPDSHGCSDCNENGTNGVTCNKCEGMFNDRSKGLPFEGEDEVYFLDYCSDDASVVYRTCISHPNSDGCQSCTNEGSTGELCQYCEENYDTGNSIEFQRKCEFPTQEFRDYTNPGVYLNGEFLEMDPFELVVDDFYQTEYTFEGYYHKDMATITESTDNIGFTSRYDFEDYTMDIIVKNETRSTINNEPIYYSYNSDVVDSVETKYLGKLKKIVYSDVYYFSDSYLTEECSTISDTNAPGTFLQSPCGSRLIKTTEVKDATDWAISGLSISCIAQRNGVVMEHTSDSSTICFEFVNNLLVKSRNFE